MVVLAGVVVRDNTIMIAKRSESKSNGGMWEFPGGKQERGESDQVTLMREFTEEFCMEINVKNYLGSFPYNSPGLNIELRVWFATVVTAPSISTDHDQIEWVTPAQLHMYTFSPADLPAVKLIECGAWISEG